MVEIAVFPIPHSVSFPGMVVPLHVFEPRYRSMVAYCIEHKMLMAVAHTERVVRKVAARTNPEDILQNNASTFKPHEIFSAGPCVIRQTLPDGRLIIQVNMERRYQSLEKIQMLPFEIHRCEAFDDDELNQTEQKATTELKDKIIHRLLAMTAGNQDLGRVIKSDAVKNMPVSDFSFGIFQLVKLDSAQEQQVLEMQSPLDRLQFVLDKLNKISI